MDDLYALPAENYCRDCGATIPATDDVCGHCQAAALAAVQPAVDDCGCVSGGRHTCGLPGYAGGGALAALRTVPGVVPPVPPSRNPGRPPSRPAKRPPKRPSKPRSSSTYRLCAEQRPGNAGHSCTLEAGHAGPHEAHGYPYTMLAAWPQEGAP